ncbi:MAG: hypothetical protein Q8N62_03805 [Candidatus Omnitrophota bacterium]|nr:hypothetical protein [Candidatus Omnitrophota bacterium]
MLNDKQGQEQSQSLNFAEKHGIVDSAFCEYFTSKAVASLDDYLGRGSNENATRAVKEVSSAKMVKFLVYEGKVAKIMCHLFNRDKCTSPLNNSEDKACILI